MARLGVGCLHRARTMFPDCFYPAKGFLSLVFRSRQAAPKIGSSNNMFVNFLTLFFFFNLKSCFGLQMMFNDDWMLIGIFDNNIKLFSV